MVETARIAPELTTIVVTGTNQTVTQIETSPPEIHIRLTITTTTMTTGLIIMVRSILNNHGPQMIIIMVIILIDITELTSTDQIVTNDDFI